MTDTSLTHLDSYCERISSSSTTLDTLLHTAEPINTLSNVGFLVSAIILLFYCIYYKLRFTRYADIYLLALLIGSIGVGSSLWHYFATDIYLLADVIPIVLFIHGYLIIYCLRMTKLSFLTTIGCWLGFVILTILSEGYLPADLMQGSIMYAPALLVLGTLTFYSWLSGHTYKHYVISSFFLFLCSLTARTIDIPLCEVMPFGTHFIWHVCNAIVLFFLTFFIIRQSKLVIL